MDMADMLKRLERFERKLGEMETKLAEETARADREAQERARQTERAERKDPGFGPRISLMEKNRANRAGDGVTNVSDKVYPNVLRRWTEFPSLHASRFNAFADAFGDSGIFPSLFEVEIISRDLSPTTRKSEEDIRPFIRAHVEAPAAKVLRAYLRRHPDPRCAAFEFSNNAYGLIRDIKAIEKPEPATRSKDDQQPPAKRRSPDKIASLNPDRWGIRVTQDDARTTALVAEYKAAHKAQAEQFRNAYHYMIVTGLMYGYVASGDCMVFLAILDTPGVLSFHLVPSSMDIEGLQPTADGTKYTPVAQLMTLAHVAVETETQPLQWIQKALADLPRWPSTKQTTSSQSKGITGPSLPPPPPPPNDDDDDMQGGGSRRSKTPQKRSLAKPAPAEPTTPSSSKASGSKSAPKDMGSQISNQKQTTRTSLQGVPYCTQACLLGLSRNGPLDMNCPNAALHAKRGCGSYHSISKAQLCSIFRDQLAENLDCGCECLDKYLMFGETGILFKITLPEYGYTLVAKGVQGVYADALVHEARVYSHCRDLQGVYVPVHLGNIDLVVPYPLQSMALVNHMMLMSWAGRTLKTYVPDDVDIDEEISQTVGMLYDAGELGGVMCIDFDLARVPTPPASKRPYEPASDEEREAKVRKVGP
ncbi:hypothetical protein B0T19DRAFT_448526 [Cercophora scortea]|uniref:Uncharacterized protein n=1 Tax=Cercophora scortea TaxID=314031 RepID=A0AAE0IWJ4_9PEZI|nr:hypothetical protein B0T19DRAFT_448526 [Cercophora scortea]